MSWNEFFASSPTWMWSYLSSFQKGTKKRAVIICQVDHMSYFFWRDHLWPAKELKKGINFSCPCALQDHKKLKSKWKCKSSTSNISKLYTMTKIMFTYVKQGLMLFKIQCLGLIIMITTRLLYSSNVWQALLPTIWYNKPRITCQKGS